MKIEGTWALPVKRELTGPAPAWTDYKNIHILNHITGEDERVLLVHESSHVWLEHDRRSHHLERQDLASIACELEIARAIYTPEELAHIKQSTILKGGATDETFPEIPKDLIYLEDIYEWLVKNAPETPPPKGTCIRHEHGGQDESEEQQTSIIKSPVQLIEEAQERVKSIPKPVEVLYPAVKRSFIASELEAANGHARLKKRSFARPSRRFDTEFTRGTKRVLAKPKVVIYVDRSGSFTPEKTAAAEDALAKLLNRYKATIESTTLYFTEGRIWDKEPEENSDTPYDAVVKSIETVKPALAVVITDDDPLPYGMPTLTQKTVVIPIGCKTTEFARHFGLPEETF
jgi:hypothetical protein